MKVCYSNHDYGVVIKAVHQRIWKTRKQATSNLRLNLWGCERKNLDEPDHAIRFIKKVKSFPLRLLPKPHEGLVYFLLSEREESDFH